MANKKTQTDGSPADVGRAASMPKTVVLDSHYSFYDDDGALLQWQEGHVVTDPEHVALLVERKAPITVKE